jgi:hypothetical protein
MTTDHPTDPLEVLVASIVETGGMLHGILSHMEAYAASGASAPDAPPPPVVLQNLLTGVLDERPGIADRTDLADVADVIAQVATAMADDLFLVAPEPPRLNRAARRRRRPC